MTATALQRVSATVPHSHLTAFHAALAGLRIHAGDGMADGQSVSFRFMAEPSQVTALQDALMCFPGIQVSA